jgi:hypothetical protein
MGTLLGHKLTEHQRPRSGNEAERHEDSLGILQNPTRCDYTGGDICSHHGPTYATFIWIIIKQLQQAMHMAIFFTSKLINHQRLGMQPTMQ